MPRAILNRLLKKGTAGGEPASGPAPAVAANGSSGNGEGEAPGIVALTPWDALSELEAWDLMVPRVDIIGLDLEDTPDELLETLRRHPFNCFPVYRKTLDDTLGFVRVKRLFDTLSRKQPIEWLSLLEKPLFAVASTRALDLMQEMYRAQIPLAIVVDEYGGVDGLVSFGDILDVLCAPPEGRRQRPAQLPSAMQVFDARIELDEFENSLGIKLDLPTAKREDIDTLGGLLFYLASEVPKRGEMVEVSPELVLEVIDADPRRVKVVRAMVKKAADTPISG